MAVYEILESARETTVMRDDRCIAVFYGHGGFSNGVDLANRFVKREQYLEQVYEARNIPDSLLVNS